MHKYAVTITMCDGSKGRHLGEYRDQSGAASRASDLFPEASRLDVLRASTVARREMQNKLKEVSCGQKDAR